MKPRVGPAVSVGLNLGLAGVLGWVWLHPPAPASPGSSELVVSDQDGAAATNEVQIRYVSRPNFHFPTNVFPRFTWRAIESPDYRRYVANLRAIHCPEKTIRDIIVADVNELYAGKWKELLNTQAKNFHYWQTGDSLPGYPDEAQQRQANELDAERKALLKELLGIDVKDSLTQFAAVNPMDLTLNFLSDEKRRQVIAEQDEFAAAQASLIAQANGGTDIGSQLQQLRDEHQRKLAGLMTPEELQRYELTTSPLAMALRSELSGFQPTEEEFREIYDARKAQEAEVEATRVFLGAQVQAQEEQEAADREAQKRAAAANSQLLEQLGPQRYAQLQRANDPNYQLLMRVSQAGALPPAAANRVYEYQQVAQVEAEKVRANPAFSLEQREVALNAIRTETERTIRENLGEYALRAYRDWNNQQSLQQAATPVAR